MPEHIAVYRRLRRVFGANSGRRQLERRTPASDERRRDESSVPYGAGRDPRGISDVLDDFTSTMGWESPLAQSELLAAWAEIVGAETAAHSDSGRHRGRRADRAVRLDGVGARSCD